MGSDPKINNAFMKQETTLIPFLFIIMFDIYAITLYLVTVVNSFPR